MAGGGRTITQRIALDGGAEVRAALEAIGKTGREAFQKLTDTANVDTALRRLGTSIADLKNRMDSVKNSGGVFAQQFARVGDALGAVTSRFGIGLGVGAVAAGKGLIDVARSSGEAAEQLENTSIALNVNAEELDAYIKVAQLAGVGPEKFVKALTKLNAKMMEHASAAKAASDAETKLRASYSAGELTYEQFQKQLRDLRQQQSENKDSFDKLGISVQKSDGTMRNSLDVYRDIGKSVGGVGDGMRRAGYMVEFFGKKNTTMTSLVTMSALEFAAMRREVERVTPALTKLERGVLDKLSDRLSLLSAASLITRQKIAAIFAPTATKIVDAMIERVVSLRDTYLEVAKALEERFSPVASDIANAIAGKDSEVQDPAVLEMRDKIVQAGQDIKNAVTELIIPAVRGIKVAVDEAAAVINKLFGTKLTGGLLLASLALLRITGLFRLFTSLAMLAYRGVSLLFTAFRAIGGVTATWNVLVGVLGTVARLVAGFVLAAGGINLVLIAIGVSVGAMFVNWIQRMGGFKAVFLAMWNGFTGIVQVVWDKIAGFFSWLGSVALSAGLSISQGLGSALAVVEQLVATAAQYIATAFAGAWAWLTSLPQQFTTAFASVQSIMAGAWGAVSQGASDLWASIQALFAAGVQYITDAFAAVPGAISGAWAGVVGFFTGLWDSVKALAVAAGDGISGALQGAVDAVVGYFKSMYDSVTGWLDTIAEKAKAVAAAVTSALGGGGGGGEPQKNARGGYIRGPGTSTSDSILSWLSNGEFVVKADAVRKFGVGFFATLNSLRVPRMPAFNTGGLVDFAMSALPPVPGFAAGGVVAVPSGGSNNGRPVTLNIGPDSFPMLAADDVVDRLEKLAVRKQVASAGRKPQWFRG
ncbi:hypothetical protein ACJMQP_04165 [Rhodopseudomonas palustris]